MIFHYDIRLAFFDADREPWLFMFERGRFVEVYGIGVLDAIVKRLDVRIIHDATLIRPSGS
jgi:hypothetical protein